MSNDKQLSETHAKVRAILTHHGVSLNGALEADLIHELLPAYVLRTAAREPSKYSDLVSDGGMDMRDRLAQQASEPVLVQGCHRSHPHENMQDTCFDTWENNERSY